MKSIWYIIGILIYSLFVFKPAGSQDMDERDIRRWLIKKPVIKVIDIKFLNWPKNEEPYFSQKKIKKILFSKESWWWLALKSDRRRKVQRETLSRDTMAVKYLYLSEGFLNVKTTETFEPIPPKMNAKIKITIDAGDQYFYGKIELEGNYASKYEREFSKSIRHIVNGKKFNPFEIREAVYNIKTVLANNGYPYARTEYIIDTTAGNNLVDITFYIEADSLVHFGDIQIVGANKYDSSLAIRELTFKKGDMYKRNDILESQTRLISTGNYITMRLESNKSDTMSIFERLNPNFTLNLREKKPHYVSLKTGAAQDSIKDLIWSAGISWGKRNFLGSRQLELSASTAFEVFTEWRLKEHNYKVQITEPWFLGIRMPLTLTGEFEPGVKSLIQPYRRQNWSVSIASMKAFGEDLKVYAGLQYQQVNIYDIDTTKIDSADYSSGTEAIEEIKRQAGLSIRRKLYINIIRDSRNSIFIPNKGSLTSMRFEYVGGFLGGGESFYILETSWARYRVVWPGWIAATRIKAGVVQETGNALSAPIDDRFYIGGANSIRGFKEQDIGGGETGSDIILIFNQEFRFPIIGKFWGSFFTDIGNGFKYLEDIELENLRVAYGVGIQFISPAGPIRLDYARRVKVDGKEPSDRIHFTILYAF